MLTEAIALASYKVQYNQSDLVLRPHQVMIFWLLAVQNWLNYHLYTLRGLFKLSHDIKAQSPQVCPKLLHNKKGNSAEAIRYLLKELHSSPRGEEGKRERGEGWSWRASHFHQVDGSGRTEEMKKKSGVLCSNIFGLNFSTSRSRSSYYDRSNDVANISPFLQPNSNNYTEI